MDQDNLHGTFGPSDQDVQNSTRLTAGQGQAESAARPYLSDNKLRPGDIVGENYIIMELLGVGGMGYVYKVRHRILEKIYAMKTISGEQVSEMAWRRLQVEAQAIARINHPNIVAIHNLGIHTFDNNQGSVPYYVMDYLKGTNLAEILQQKRYLTLEQSLPIFIEICNGLGYAHKKGIVHRDIKPGNIVILDEPDFSGARVKIVDFGIAKLAGTIDPENQKLTTIGEVFGSPLYMSPEQCEGKRIDARSDIYSLGCTFFETLTSDAPFHGKTPVETMLMHCQTAPPTLYEASGLDFPDSMEDLVATLLAKEPMNRYPNLEKVSEDLQNILEGREISAKPFNAHGIANLLLDDSDKGSKSSAVGTKTIQAIESITPRKVAILASLLVASLVTITVYFTNQRTIDSTTAVATKALAVKQTQTPAEKYSHILTNGSIQFDFPEKQSIGDIALNMRNTNGRPAQGKLTFKKNQNLYFYPNAYAMAHPECFNSFRSDDLYSVTTPESSLVTDVDNGQEVDVNLAIPYIAKLTGLKQLNLNVSNASDGCLEEISKITSLQNFRANNTDITGAGLGKLPQLKNLQSISFSHNNDGKDLMKALAGSTAIDTLYLEGQTIDEEVAHLLASCKNLKHLDIEGSTADDKVLEIITTAPNLNYLAITSCPVTAEVVAKLRKAHAHVKIVQAKAVRTSLENSFGGEDPANWLLPK